MNHIKKYLLNLLFPALIIAGSFHPTPDRDFDMIHSKITVNIDIYSKSVEGNVTHEISVLADEIDKIVLNTEDTQIKSVNINGQNIPDFELSENKLFIPLSRKYEMDENISISIDYKSYPKLGCYFVQPDSIYPEKHYQAWTQGEQMHNHHWVPLHDYPNDKGTFECILTVDRPFVAVSNGSLEKITKSKGKRTFFWKESAPMVSYLISFVVGEYQEIKDNSINTPVSYWVYPEHDRSDALRSFGHTPEMLRLFNDYIQFPYPFEKYDQIIIEDFMWGGMENITLSHMADRTMHKESAIPHHSSEWLVAHELAHQWFGDLLTTRNWANIWLNEGITSFMELIWAEHKYGYSEKEYYRLKELRATIQASRGKKPMVFFNYDNSNDLFDANVYAKGAVVMNMLKNYIGEKPFQKAIQFYTKENAYKNVESYDLKKAFEETTGKNLYWFFDQWVYRPGLPELTVYHRFDKSKGGTIITVEQTQDTSFSSKFRLPVTILIDDGKINRFYRDLKKTKQEYFFPTQKPKMVVFDEGYQIPKIIQHKKSDEELTYQLLNAPHVNDRISAAKEMGKKKNGRKFIKALFYSLSSDEFWGARKESASALTKMKLNSKEAQIINLYQQESDARVKSEILNLFNNLKDNKLTSFLAEVILNEKNDYVVRSAVHSLSNLNEDSLMNNLDFILSRESHNDIVRKAGISKLSSIKSDSNFLKLMELASYGGTTWNSRTTAVRGLESYIKDHPMILDEMVQFLMDPNYRVRWIAVNTLCKYGGEAELDQMMEIVSNDPLTQFEYSSGKYHLKNRMKNPKSYPGAKRTPKKLLSKIFNEMDKITRE